MFYWDGVGICLLLCSCWEWLVDGIDWGIFDVVFWGVFNGLVFVILVIEFFKCDLFGVGFDVVKDCNLLGMGWYGRVSMN